MNIFKRLFKWLFAKIFKDPIVIESKTDYVGSVSPPALNTETTVVEITAQTDDYLVEGWIDLSPLATDDEVVITEYISVDGTNYRIFIKTTFTGEQEQPIIRFHTKTFYKNMMYKVTITQTAGTLRSFPYAFILEVMGVV